MPAFFFTLLYLADVSLKVKYIMHVSKTLQALIISQDASWVHQCLEVLIQLKGITVIDTVTQHCPDHKALEDGNAAYDVILVDTEELSFENVQEATKEWMQYNPELAIVYFVESLDALQLDALFELGVQDVIDRNTLSQGQHVAQRVYYSCLRSQNRALHCGDVLLQHVKKHNEELRRLAHLDYLTQLPNRLQFDKAVKKAVAHAKRHHRLMSVLIIDVDNFKTINDTLGHAVGDLLLQGIAKRLRQVVREEDIIARTGGDEFVVIVTEMRDHHAAGRVAEKIIRSLQQTFYLNEHQVHATASIGLACYPIAGEDSKTLIEHADVALYKAKERGRNNYQYYISEESERFHHKLYLDNELRFALEREQLFLVYQPQFHLQTKEVIGVEALLRWQHPSLGLIMPNDFIPIAEETGFIIPIGRWLMKKACQQFLELSQESGHLQQLSLNLSSAQLHDEKLIEVIETVQSRVSTVDAGLCMELAETAMMTATSDAESKLLQINRLGVGIAIDDFGTGFSSLRHLKELPISALKIDKIFIQDLLSNKNDEIIVKSILALADSLQVKVIAEGIENQAQFEFLNQSACGYGQGNYLMEPLSAKRFIQWRQALAKAQ